MKISKSEYINDLEYKIKWFTELVNDKKTFRHWVMGEQLTRYQIKQILDENQDEKLKIESDKNYKPWND